MLSATNLTFWTIEASFTKRLCERETVILENRKFKFEEEQKSGQKF